VIDKSDRDQHLEKANYKQPILPSVQMKHWFLWGFATVWNLISLPATMGAWEEIPRIHKPEDFMILLVLLFPLTGIFLLWQALRATILHSRYGGSELRLDPAPGQAGGQVGGTIRLSSPLPQDTQCEVRLECRHSHETRNSKGQKQINSRVLWQDELMVRGHMEAGATLVPFVFDVPADLPASEPESRDWKHWQVHVAADIPGLDLALEFDVPVLPGQAKSMVRIAGRERQQQLQRAQQLAALLNIEQQGKTLFLHSDYGRERGGSLFLAVFGLVFLAVGIGLGFANMGPGVIAIPAKLVFCSAFSGIGLLVFLMGALTLTTRLDTAIERDVVHVKRSFLGREVYRRSMPLSEITGLETHKNGSSTMGKRTQNWFQLRVQYNGRWQPIAESIPGRILADAALAFLRANTPLA